MAILIQPLRLVLAPFLQYYNAAPVQNTWYTAFTSVRSGGLLTVMAYQAATAAAAKTYEMRWTVDGRVLTGSQLMVSGTSYYVVINGTSNAIAYSTSTWCAGIYDALPYISCKVEVRITDVPAALADTYVWINYFDAVASM